MILVVTYRAWLEGQGARQDEVGEFARRLAAMDPAPRAWTPTGVLNHIRRMGLSVEDEDHLTRLHALSVEDYRKHRGDLQEVPALGEELPHPDEPPEVRELILAVQEALLVQTAMLSVISTRLGLSAEDVTEAIAYARYRAAGGRPEADEQPDSGMPADLPLDFGLMWAEAAAAEAAGVVEADG